jgi:hypothetical protein
VFRWSPEDQKESKRALRVAQAAVKIRGQEKERVIDNGAVVL